MSFTFGGLRVFDPQKAREIAQGSSKSAPLPLHSWWGLPNQYTCSLGGMPGTGHLLMLYEDLESLGANDICASSCSGNGNDALRELIISHPRETVTFPSIMIAGHCECISSGAFTDPKSLYLTPIADRRWLYWHQGTPLTKSYNLRSDSDGSYLPQSLNAGSPWTWQQMLDDLWPTEGGDTSPTLPFTPNGVPEGFWFTNLADMRCHHFVLVRLCCRLKYDPIADTFSIVRLGMNGGATAVAYRALKEKYQTIRIWDDCSLVPESTVIPQTVRTSFRQKPVTSDQTVLYSSKDADTGVASGLEVGTFVALNDDLYDIGTNNAELTSRAGERTVDYVRWRQFFTVDDIRMYSGMIGTEAIAATGELIEKVSWEDRGDGLKTGFASGLSSEEFDWKRDEFPFLGCTQIEKVYGPNCWYGGSTLRRVFWIKRGCEILASGCEDVGVCDDLCSASGAGPGGPSDCACDGLSPNYWLFTLSGMTDGVCAGCDVLDGNWCLAKFNDCGFSQVRSAVDLCGNPTQTTGALLQIFVDGSAVLIIGTATSLNLATYYFPAGLSPAGWDCNGPNNTMSLLTSSAYCGNWPANLTLSSSANNLLCTDPPGGGHDCAACGSHATANIDVPTAGWSDGSCTSCSNLGSASPISLADAGGCTWQNGVGPGLTCGGSPVVPSWTLYDNGVDGWYVDIMAGATLIATYFTPYAAWSCDGVNLMNVVFADATACVGWPSQISAQLA